MTDTMVAFNEKRIYKASRDLIFEVAHQIHIIEGFKNPADRAPLTHGKPLTDAIALVREFLDETLARAEWWGQQSLPAPNY